jgi:uncharacterized protein (DUF1919 family)
MLFGLRHHLARWRDLAVTRQDITLISDDCWAAEFYRLLRIPYLTPSVGLYVEVADYLDFVSNLRAANAFQLRFIPSEKAYPVARTPYATLHFMHYSSEDEAREKFLRRAARINWEQLFIKVDFGKPDYTAMDVARWNGMKLPNSLAIVPESSPFARQAIWNAMTTPYWEINGARMFAISRNFFDFPHWTRTGNVRCSIRNRLVREVVQNQIVPGYLKRTLMG